MAQSNDDQWREVTRALNAARIENIRCAEATQRLADTMRGLEPKD